MEQIQQKFIFLSHKIQNRCSELVAASPLSGDSRSQTLFILWSCLLQAWHPDTAKAPLPPGWQKKKERERLCVGGFCGSVTSTQKLFTGAEFSGHTQLQGREENTVSLCSEEEEEIGLMKS